MINRILPILPALACALLAQAVHAQSPSQPPAPSKSQSQPPAKPQQESQGGFLYKSTMPDGKVIYGDGPMPGAVKVEKTKPDTSKKGITAATPKEKEALRRMEAERASSGSAAGPQGRTQAYSGADLEAKLREMEADREKAKEPLAGERIGTAGGGSRFTDAYWERQKRLDQGMESLRKEIEKARSAR
jgi:hypothetical protein